MKNTPQEHPDYDNLVEAKNRFSVLSDKVDQDLADFKSKEKVMQLSSILVFKKKLKVWKLLMSMLRGNINIMYFRILF